MISPEFEEMLAKEFSTWDKETLPNPGLLKIEMTGSGFLHGLNEEKAQEIIKLMKEHFPEDAVFYWPFGIKRLVMWEGTHGTGSDLFYVVFASKEWEPVKEDAAIPSVCIDNWLH